MIDGGSRLLILFENCPTRISWRNTAPISAHLTSLNVYRDGKGEGVPAYICVVLCVSFFALNVIFK